MSEREVFEIFKSAFITNCELDGASVTEEERTTLGELDFEEVLENLKDLVNDLLAFKQKFRQSNEQEIIERSEQFEALIQKLEGEVRGHIGVEHQLKLHVENTQSKLEELETQHEKTKQRLRELEHSSPKAEDYKKKIEQMVTTADKRETLIKKLEGENTALRKQIEDKNTEVKKNYSKQEIFRKRSEEKRSEDHNKIRLGDKAPFKVTREMLRASQKRTDTEIYRNSPAPYLSKDTKPINRGYKSISKQHVRSISDNRPYFAKRAPSR